MATKGSVFRDDVLSDRERKNLSILDVIRRKGPISRTDISRNTGLNIVTVSHYVDNYVKRGLVYEKGCDISSGGRKPTLVELNYKAFYIIGVDVGPEKIVGAITDLSASVVSKLVKPRPDGQMDEVLAKTSELVHELINKAGAGIDQSKIKGLGIGVSGVIDKRADVVHDTDELRGATSGSYGSVKAYIEKEFNIPAFVGNDATVAAYGERWLGLEQDVDNVVYFYSDVGCGIIVKGDIYTGAGGSAGEMQLNLNSPDVKKLGILPEESKFLRPCGGVDCGITANARHLVKEGTKTQISDIAKGKIENIDTQTVIKAAKLGDQVALEIIENAALNLGVRIAYFINLFNPEVVIIGGGIEEAGEFLLAKIRKTVKSFAFEEPASLAKIVPARLGENGVSLGASLLVMRELFAEI
jgi:predicted NBD/HSP70 family sugar kinase